MNGIRVYLGMGDEKIVVGVDSAAPSTWAALNEKDIWIRAIGQVFFSLGLCMGCVTAYSSFNPKNQNISRDGKIICIRFAVWCLLSAISNLLFVIASLN